MSSLVPMTPRLGLRNRKPKKVEAAVGVVLGVGEEGVARKRLRKACVEKNGDDQLEKGWWFVRFCFWVLLFDFLLAASFIHYCYVCVLLVDIINFLLFMLFKALAF